MQLSYIFEIAIISDKNPSTSDEKSSIEIKNFGLRSKNLMRSFL